MHVLLSGASGFLGSARVDLFRRFPEIELSVVRSSSAECVLPLGSREIFLRDLTNPSELTQSLGMRRPTHIVHLSALSSPLACEQDPQLAQRGNVGFTKTLVDLASMYEAHFIITSTDLVFDGVVAPPAGFSERDQPCPAAVYSRTKFEAEQVAQGYERGCVVRLCLLYGHSLSRSRGVLGWMEETLRAQQELLLFEDEFRTPIHVADAAHALFKLTTSNHTGLWHCGGPEAMSRVEFGTAVAEALGYNSDLIRPARRRDLPSVPPRPENVSLNSSALWGLLGTTPRSVRDALAQDSHS